LGTSSTSNNTDTPSNVFLPDRPVGSTRKIEGEEDPVTFTVTLNGVKEEEADPVSQPLRNKRRAQETDEQEDTEMEVRT
jgi:hypothetical protein